MVTKKTPNVKCVLCGFNRVIFQNNGKAHFGSFDLENGNFIQMRDTSGGKFPDGKGRGFPLIPEECLTIKEASSSPEYQSLLQQIDSFALKWLKFRKTKA